MTTLTKYQEKSQEIEHFKLLATIASKGGTAGKPEDLMNIMLTAKDLGISPMKAINGGFYIVKGKISMSTALMTDRIRKEGHSIKIPEWTSEKCVIIGVRKDNGDSIKFEFTMEDAKAAGLNNSDNWKKYPKQMLYNRAMSTLARTLFPDVVGNAYSEDEKWDIMEIPPEKRPAAIEDNDDIEIIGGESVVSEIPMPVITDYINEKQISTLNDLIKNLDEESKLSFFSWIKKEFNANNIQEIPNNAFDKCIRSIGAKIKYLNDKKKDEQKDEQVEEVSA